MTTMTTLSTVLCPRYRLVKVLDLSGPRCPDPTPQEVTALLETIDRHRLD